MSTEARKPGGSSSSSHSVTPHYGTSVPTESSDTGGRKPKCVTGFSFLMTIHGILNIVIILAVVFIIICGSVSDKQSAYEADASPPISKAKVSAVRTRNAVIAFGVIGLILIVADTILHVTTLITKLPNIFDTIFIYLMFVLAAIYLILGCCAAAWEKKMSDTVGIEDKYRRRGAAGAASFFLFTSMIAIIGAFVLRLTRPAPSPEYQ